MFRYSCIGAAVLLSITTVSYAQQMSDNLFNPALSLILVGTYSQLSRSPNTYAISGFIPSGADVAPPPRGFNLGESELAASSNIDPYLYGQFTLSLGADNTTAVEEAWIQTLGLDNGFTLRAGRGFSNIGYINEQHSHVWDFVDAPLAQKVFLGGQYASDGVQLKWLAPTDRFIEVGAELGNGKNFPGSARDKNGAGGGAVFVHVGDDFNDSNNWRAGISYLKHTVLDRAFTDNGVSNAFNGDSGLWIVDAVWKWAPHGEMTRTNFKLQTEYYRRHESGTLRYDSGGVNQASDYQSTQSGAYIQAVYQFMPYWRVGTRYDRLQRGTVDTGSININNLPILAAYSPTRTSVMMDYSPSEFSRFRLQLAQDKSQLHQTDNELMLQYQVSLGSHGAHKY
ncbi:MAG: hypothetical protein HY080_15065 [Gammaproteobacteria bacterium]|nr:hypothetical protein [Gammaproteobacteria bacterium]